MMYNYRGNDFINKSESCKVLPVWVIKCIIGPLISVTLVVLRLTKQTELGSGLTRHDGRRVNLKWHE